MRCDRGVDAPRSHEPDKRTPLQALTSSRQAAVPFFGVINMQAWLRFYFDGLGFQMKRWWISWRAQPRREDSLVLAGAWRCRHHASGVPAGTPAKGNAWHPEHRCVSCATTHWRFTASSNHAEYRRGSAHLWETASGQYRSAIPTATASISKAQLMRQRRANWKNSVGDALT